MKVLVLLLVGSFLVAGVAVAGAVPASTPSVGVRAADALADGNRADAEDEVRKSLAETEARTGADSLETASALDQLVDTLLRVGKGQDPETRRSAKRALAIKGRVFGRDHVEAVKGLEALANLLHAWPPPTAGASEGARAGGARVREVRRGTVGAAAPLVT